MRALLAACLCAILATFAAPAVSGAPLPVQPSYVYGLQEANETGNTVFVSTGTGSAAGTDALDDAYFPSGIAATSDGTFWVSDDGSSCVAPTNPGHANALREYTPEQQGSASFTISGADTQLGCTEDVAVSGADGTVWALGISPLDLLAYSPTGSSDQSPRSAITLAGGGINDGFALSVSPDGKDLYIAGGISTGNSFTGAIEEVSAVSSKAAKPIRLITGPQTGLDQGVIGVAVGLDGTIYATSGGNFLTFRPGANGDAAPQSVGTPGGSFSPEHLSLSTTGTVFVTGNGEVIDTVADPTGTPTFQTFATDADPLDGVAVYATPPRPVTALNPRAEKNAVALSWLAPSGSPLGYTVSTATDAGGPFTPVKYVPSTATGTVSTTVRDLASGHRVYFEVQAGNDGGVAAQSFVNSATPYSTPSPPRGLTLMRHGHTLTASWKAPTSAGGKPITGYDVVYGLCKPGHHGCATSTVRVGASQHSARLRTTAGKIYYAVVDATNPVGTSPPSPVVTTKA